MDLNDFTPKCLSFLEQHQKTTISENEIIAFLKEKLPSSVTHLEWSDVTDKITIPNVVGCSLKGRRV